MSDRHLPVRPNLQQLKHQAKDLLRAVRRGDPGALTELRDHHPDPPTPESTRLADAQLALARSYGVRSWPRLVRACEVTDAIWRDDRDALRAIIERHPELLHENASGRDTSSWGPPLSYAANLGRDEIIEMLHDLGAHDLERAVDRAALQGHVDTARRLHQLRGSPTPPSDALEGPAYTLNVPGTALMLELGAPVRNARGGRLAPVDVVLESDSRNPEAKHRILELYASHGLELPDTPTLALHRGRIDLLAAHLERDPDLLTRTFTHEEIYPPDLGCHDEILATQGTPLAGGTLLHLCMDYDERDIARWLLDHGADVNARAAVDPAGFGGHTALFCTVVSQPNYWHNRRGETDAPLTALLLEHGADPNVRASLRKQLHPGYGGDTMHEYRDVTALSWGRRFHDQRFVNLTALRLIAARGGGE